jgi:hypothetical protein
MGKTKTKTAHLCLSKPRRHLAQGNRRAAPLSPAGLPPCYSRRCSASAAASTWSACCCCCSSCRCVAPPPLVRVTLADGLTFVVLTTMLRLQLVGCGGAAVVWLLLLLPAAVFFVWAARQQHHHGVTYVSLALMLSPHRPHDANAAVAAIASWSR